MRWWLPVAVAAVLSAACAPKPSPPLASLDLRFGPSAPPPPQPATAAEAIGGLKFTGYVRVTYGENDNLVIASTPGALTFSCNKTMADWRAGGRVGKAPCATVTLELDGEPPNFYLASYWSAKPLLAMMAQAFRTAPRIGAGFAASSSVMSSPAMQALQASMLDMYRGLLELVGATTPEACEALRPLATDQRVGDGRCQSARLMIY